MEQIILPKNIFLPHFEIVQNFHYFERSVPVAFQSKIQFSKNWLKCYRNVSFDLLEQIVLPKTFLYPILRLYIIFTILKGPHLSIFYQKFNFPKTASNIIEMFLLMSGTNNFAKKYFLTPF